jgi:hypothetical protein
MLGRRRDEFKEKVFEVTFIHCYTELTYLAVFEVYPVKTRRK